MRFRRLIALVLTLVVVLSVLEVPNHAQEDLVIARSRALGLTANPVYVVAAPPQDRIPAKPPNLPIPTLRKSVPTPAPGETITALPFPMSASQAVAIGEGLIQDKDYYSALVYFQEARKLQPTLVAALIGLGRCYYELQRDSEALAVYQSLSEPQANDWEVQFILGRIYLESGKFAEAVDVFTKAHQLKPDDLDTTSNLALALTRVGRHNEAITFLTQVIALRRFVPQDFYNLGEAYANAGDWLKAADAFKGVGGIDPEPYSLSGIMLYNADKLDQALETFNKVKQLDLNASHAESSYYMADIFRRLGNLQEALGNYNRVLTVQPDNVDALVQVAYICFKLSQFGDAERHYLKLAKLDPTNPALSNLAALQSKENEFKKDTNRPTPGITLLEVARANPNNGETHINLGAQYITEASYPEAIKVLEQAVTLLPNSAAAHFNLGLAQLRSGDYQGAIASNQRALQLKPAWPEAYNDLGFGYASLKRWNEAAQAYSEAINLNTNYKGAIFNLGIALVELGRNEAAKPLLDRLTTTESSDLRARLANRIAGLDETGRRLSGTSTSASSAVESVTERLASSPTPTPAVAVETPQPQATETPKPQVTETTSTQQPSPTTDTGKTPESEGCPGPTYGSSDVTQKATILSQFPSFFTEDALKNNVSGRMILQVTLCSNGRVSDIAVEKYLPYGLVERATELLKLMKFEPALLNGKQVSVRHRQEFFCLEQTCKAVVP